MQVAQSIGSIGTKIKVFSDCENNVYFDSIDLNCKHSVLLNHEYHYPGFLQTLPWLYCEKVIRFSGSIAMFFASIWSSAFEGETTISAV